jgi:hypothetical protein
MKSLLSRDVKIFEEVRNVNIVLTGGVYDRPLISAQ